ncbi:hypothetical protein LWC08_09155 [Desulfobaculum bizertense]|uniref:phage regulatory CII family protein n=1 Tax=Desulfobaculum bizertense TaxID=376490 RepID=UPI001F48CCEA|nr:phage regulatory CII family protein [Desulfobaculum bizertense]UIJ36907.1 hypothetical protein LWC08_09155 [Desulfobaculum bizertense]
MNTPNLSQMSLPAAMQLAESLSGLSRDEISAAMGWNPCNGSRVLNPNDPYWPSLPNLPKFCAVVGNTVLLDWAKAQLSEGALHRLEPMDASSFIMGLGQLFKEMADVAEVGGKCVQDGDVSPQDAKKIMRELLDVLQKGQEMFIRLDAVRTQG